MLYREPDDRDHAYHEAGHAVVAWRLGRRFIKVTMTAIVRRKGICNVVSARIDTCTKAKAEIMIELAGALAECIFRPQPLPVHKGDICRARNIAEYYRGDEATIWIDELQDRTRDELDRLWPQVTAVALALLEREELTEAEVRDICEQAAEGGIDNAEGE